MNKGNNFELNQVRHKGLYKTYAKLIDTTNNDKTNCLKRMQFLNCMP